VVHDPDPGASDTPLVPSELERIRAPPPANTLNSFAWDDLLNAGELSPHTKDPGWSAEAPRPAALFYSF